MRVYQHALKHWTWISQKVSIYGASQLRHVEQSAWFPFQQNVTIRMHHLRVFCSGHLKSKLQTFTQQSIVGIQKREPAAACSLRSCISRCLCAPICAVAEYSHPAVCICALLGNDWRFVCRTVVNNDYLNVANRLLQCRFDRAL